MALKKARQMLLDPIESTPGKNITNPDDGSESTNKFVSSLVINLALALVAIFLFSFLRPRLKRIYSPRQLLLDMMFPLGKLPNSFFAWVIPAFMANDDDVFYYAGIDAVVYMRFLKLCIKISLVIMPYGIAVLLPLNYYGKGGLFGLDRVAMSNVKEGSTKLWAHLVAAWFYTVIICYLLYEEWKVYIMYRQEYLTCGKGHQYAVLLRDLPVKFQNEQSIKSYIEELFPDQVEDVIVVEDLSRWQKLVDKHDNLVWKLERSRTIYEKTGERPTHRASPCGSELDSITQHESDLMSLQAKLEAEMNRDHSILPAAIVIFRTLRMATTAVQVRWDNSPLAMNMEPAPEVSNMIWNNLAFGLWRRKFCTALVYVAIFMLVFFWATPVAFISSLITLENIAKKVPFLDPVLSYSTFVRGIIEGFLSSVALWVFFAILPLVLEKLTNQEGIASKSEVAKSVLGKLYIFVIVNQFLFLSAGSAALSKVEELAKEPVKITSYLAESLPAQSTFFICYIMLRSFTGLSLELLRVVDLIVIPVKRRWFCYTPREDEAAWRPPPIMYDRVYTDHLLVLVVGLSYSALAPLITPFVALYFGLGYIVWMHQILCVYIPVYSCGGLMWPKLFNRVIASMIVFHLLMMGVLSLKESFITSAAMVPLPIFTFLFFAFIQQHFVGASMYLSLSMASGLQEASPHFLQDVARRYVRNHQLPPTYGRSTSYFNGDYLYEYEEISSDVAPDASWSRDSPNEELA
ncbi:uncharacterized protein [Porites lutea]|uniref:uncharacterized protein n=1 Tax=Porites lutea TaxID=51062 RepID=UPI003CC6C435